MPYLAQVRFTSFSHARSRAGLEFCAESEPVLSDAPKFCAEPELCAAEFCISAAPQSAINAAKINKNLFDMLEVMKNFYHIALVTTASEKNTEEILKFFYKRDLFELIISAEDVKNKKPNSEGFIKAMDHFNINPEDTIIFEDSNVGIEAAIRSGANVLKIEKF